MCAMILERYGDVLDLEVFFIFYNCVSALRNFSLPLLLRIHQLVVFFFLLFLLENSGKKNGWWSRGEIENPYFPLYGELLYLSLL